LAAVKQFADLEFLTLAGTRITDVGLEQLVGMTNLKQLILFKTQITDEGVKKLQQALPNCRITR